MKRIVAFVFACGYEAYPATGGTYIGEPALHVRYPGGNHNTELRYVSHHSAISDGTVTTTILLRDALTALEVKLVFQAWQKEDVILAHSEITNRGKGSLELLDYASSSVTIEAESYLLTHFHGAMRWCNEFWTSDNTDAISRARIQYATSMIYPAFAMASHVSAVPNHQTGNVTPLKMRFDMAAAGRLGMELQPANLSEGERAFARRCIRTYKSFRDVVEEGNMYRLASPYDSDFYAFMYVTDDKSRAVVFTFCLRYQNRERYGSHSFRLSGLDPSARYLVTELNVDSSCWWGSGKVFSGDFLSEGGFTPVLSQANSSAVFLLETVK